MKSYEEYIKATTAYGGDDYGNYSHLYTPEKRTAFEDWLAIQPRAAGVTLYRGYCFDRRYWEDCNVEEGDTIGEDQMTAELDLPAFTEGPMRAANYMNEFGGGVGWGGVKVFFEIRTSGKYFVDISPWSRYPSEREYRCVRDTRLAVVSVSVRGGFTKVVCEER